MDAAPRTLPLLVRAALPKRRTGDTLPDLTLTRDDVRIDREHVAAYSRVCGFPLKASLPVAYPHVLAFGLHLSIMTDASFPFPALGTVHLENRITAHRAITDAERLDVSAHAEALRPHAKGRLFDLVTQVRSGGELVWEETSTFLRRGGGDRAADRAPDRAPDREQTFEQVPATGARWSLPGDLGRRYAGVSGDHNPIHLYGLTAKALGFPRQIAHGMWSKARCLAALDGRLPAAVTVAVAFKKPILLPGAVAFGSARSGDGYAFSLSNPTTGAPHLLGSAAGNAPPW